MIINMNVTGIFFPPRLVTYRCKVFLFKSVLLRVYLEVYWGVLISLKEPPYALLRLPKGYTSSWTNFKNNAIFDIPYVFDNRWEVISSFLNSPYSKRLTPAGTDCNSNLERRNKNSYAKTEKSRFSHWDLYQSIFSPT